MNEPAVVDCWPHGASRSHYEARIDQVWVLPVLYVLVLVLPMCSGVSGNSSSISGAGTRTDGAVRLKAPPGGASDQNPAFSPDGSRLVFSRFDDGYNDGPAGLYLLELSTGRVDRLTPKEDQDHVNLPGAAWDANSNRIIFASDRHEAYDLWRVAPDGTDLVRVTAHEGLPWYIEPSWSPVLKEGGEDGQWIVFEVRRPGGSDDAGVGEIWKARSDGTGLVQLTAVSGYDDRQPNWSPTGDRILFQRRTLPDGQWSIYTMSPDGGNSVNVTGDNGSSDTDASWSPDGACIVYSSDHGDLDVPNIFVITGGGGQPVRVTWSNAHEDSAPSWSPDGQWIAFESREGHSEDGRSALWQIRIPEGTCHGTGIGVNWHREANKRP